MICSKCNIEMTLGQAIEPDIDANALYIVRPPMINSDTLNLITVYKCLECGHSEEIE